MSESKEQETIADIVAEMRNGPCCWLTPEGIPQHNHDNDLFSSFADRIEAAFKREHCCHFKDGHCELPTTDNQRELEDENRRLRDEAQRDVDVVMCNYGKLVRGLRAEIVSLKEAVARIDGLYKGAMQTVETVGRDVGAENDRFRKALERIREGNVKCSDWSMGFHVLQNIAKYALAESEEKK